MAVVADPNLCPMKKPGTLSPYPCSKHYFEQYLVDYWLWDSFLDTLFDTKYDRKRSNLPHLVVHLKGLYVPFFDTTALQLSQMTYIQYVEEVSHLESLNWQRFVDAQNSVILEVFRVLDPPT